MKIVMDYNDILELATEIIKLDSIKKNGLIMYYELTANQHKALDEHLYYRGNPKGTDFKHSDVIELDVNGLLFKFVIKS